MSTNRILTVHGPEALPDAGIRLLDDKEMNAVCVRGFFEEHLIVSGLDEKTDKRNGHNERPSTSPPLTDYGQVPAEAFEEMRKRSLVWLGDSTNNFSGLTPQNEVMPDNVSHGRTALHVDQTVLDRISGPLTASIGIRKSGIFFVTRGESVVDGQGQYDQKRHSDIVHNWRDRWFWYHHRLFSRIVQHPTDLILFTNVPEPSPHGVPIVQPKRKATIYDLVYHTSVLIKPTTEETIDGEQTEMANS